MKLIYENNIYRIKMNYKFAFLNSLKYEFFLFKMIK